MEGSVRMTARVFWLTVAITALNTPVNAYTTRFSPSSFGGGFGGYNGDSNGGDDDGDDNGFGFANDDDFNQVGTWQSRRVIHGVLGALAFVVLFPIGSISLKVFPGRAAFLLHVLVQMAAWVVYIAAAALGFSLVRDIQFPGQEDGWLFTNPQFNYHPIIGVVLLVLLFIQPFLGWLHHRNFKRYQRRTVSSYLHLSNGRVLIILGIVNGGLGLHIAGASDTIKLAYTIVAAVLGGSWVVLAFFGEVRRAGGKDVFGRQKSEGRSVGMERGYNTVRKDSVDHGEDGRRHSY